MLLVIPVLTQKKYLGLFRAGLNIGKTGQMPGVLRFWGPRA